MSDFILEDNDGSKLKLSFYNDSIDFLIKDVDDESWSYCEISKHDVIPLIKTLLEYIAPPMIRQNTKKECFGLRTTTGSKMSTITC